MKFTHIAAIVIAAVGAGCNAEKLRGSSNASPPVEGKPKTKIEAANEARKQRKEARRAESYRYEDATRGTGAHQPPIATRKKSKQAQQDNKANAYVDLPPCAKTNPPSCVGHPVDVSQTLLPHAQSFEHKIDSKPEGYNYHKSEVITNQGLTYNVHGGRPAQQQRPASPAGTFDMPLGVPIRDFQGQEAVPHDEYEQPMLEAYALRRHEDTPMWDSYDEFTTGLKKKTSKPKQVYANPGNGGVSGGFDQGEVVEEANNPASGRLGHCFEGEYDESLAVIEVGKKQRAAHVPVDEQCHSACDCEKRCCSNAPYYITYGSQFAEGAPGGVCVDIPGSVTAAAEPSCDYGLRNIDREQIDDPLDEEPLN